MINGFVLLNLPPAEAATLALPDGEAADRLHLTLVGITGEEMTIEHLSNRLEQWAGDQPPLSGEITGFGIFSEGSDGKPVLYATFDSPALPEFRQALADWLVESGYDLKQDYGFVPHITLKYLDGEPAQADIPDLPPLKITFSQLTYSQKREDGEFDLYPFNLNPKEVSMLDDEKTEAADVDNAPPTKAAPDPATASPTQAGESPEPEPEAVNAPALKAEIDPDQGEVIPPNYHEAATLTANRCGSCGFFEGGHCRNYEIPVEVGFVCDDWTQADTPYGEGATKAAAEETPGAAEGETSPAPVEAEIKAGARHSKQDMARIQTLHDTTAELGAICKSDANKFAFVKGWSLNERQAQIIYVWEQKRQPGYPRDILDDAVIIARDGALFSYPYTVNGSDITFGEPVQVVVRYTPEVKAFDIQDPDFAIKALREAEGGLVVGGPLVLWGSPDRKDLSGDYFLKSTELWLDRYPKAPALFHHGLDQAVGLSVVGHRIKAYTDDIGAWVETWLDKRSKYLKMIRPLLEAKALFYSPGSASHLVRRAEDGYLKAFPVIEDTLTPTPMQHRLLPLEQIKSAYRILGLDDPLEQAQPAGEVPVPVPAPVSPVPGIKAALLDEILKLDSLAERYVALV